MTSLPRRGQPCRRRAKPSPAMGGEAPRALCGCAVGAARPDDPLADQPTKAVGIEGYGVLDVGKAIGEAHVLRIRADGDKHGVALADERLQNSNLRRLELCDVIRPLQVEKASVYLQDMNRRQ